MSPILPLLATLAKSLEAVSPRFDIIPLNQLAPLPILLSTFDATVISGVVINLRALATLLPLDTNSPVFNADLAAVEDKLTPPVSVASIASAASNLVVNSAPPKTLSNVCRLSPKFCSLSTSL